VGVEGENETEAGATRLISKRDDGQAVGLGMCSRTSSADPQELAKAPAIRYGSSERLTPPMPIQVLPIEILEEAPVLFEDTRVENIDPAKHAGFVIARVLDRGTMRSVAALVRTYGLGRIRDFLRSAGARQVSRRTLSLWTAFLNLPIEECTSRSYPQSRSPFWKD
jgi:hypothetical protein